MAETPPDPALRDPFFSTLRREHPDVTLVMLPPETAAAFPGVDEQGGMTLSQAQELERSVRDAMTLAVEALGVEPTATTALWWAQGAPGAYQRLVRGAVTGVETPLYRLGAAQDNLTEAGWEVAAHAVPVPRIDGRLGAMRMRITAYPTALQVQVTSDTVRLATTVLAELEGRSS